MIPKDLKYIASHEWVRDHGDGSVTIGITDHAQDALGDVVFIELPAVGSTLATDEGFGVVESVKAASDLYAPVAGEVMAVNEALESSPELINASPYEDGWMIRLKLNDPGELDQLLDATAYTAVVEAES